jgi:Tfp pilus assembly protein PilP
MNKRWQRLVLAAGATMLVLLPVVAQQPAESKTAPAASEPKEGEFNIEQNLEDVLQQPLGADSYRYDSQGRRDPFRSLIGPRQSLGEGERPPGVPGFLVDEIDLSGVVRTKQGLVAMIKGPDNKGYLVRVGDKVFDGELIRIAQGSIVFRQEVNDPTQIERYKEVVKELVPQTVKK